MVAAHVWAQSIGAMAKLAPDIVTHGHMPPRGRGSSGVSAMTTGEDARNWRTAAGAPFGCALGVGLSVA